MVEPAVEDCDDVRFDNYVVESTLDLKLVLVAPVATENHAQVKGLVTELSEKQDSWSHVEMKKPAATKQSLKHPWKFRRAPLCSRDFSNVTIGDSSMIKHVTESLGNE